MLSMRSSVWRTPLSQSRRYITKPFSRSQSTWNPQQYLQFNDERNTPIHDLLAKLPLSRPPTSIIDLGCGPGNSTALLAQHFPTAHLTAMDSSPEMLRAARTSLPTTSFFQADLATYTPGPQEFDLLFSNAVFHWLPSTHRIPTMLRLLEPLAPGSILALQVPDNADEPSHTAMSSIRGPWDQIHLSHGVKPNERFSRPEAIYSALKPVCETVSVWHVVYNHVVEDHGKVVEWVKGTGLRPFVDVLPEDIRAEYLKRYLEEVRKGYPSLGDGRVMLRYPRLFVVAVRG